MEISRKVSALGICFVAACTLSVARAGEALYVSNFNSNTVTAYDAITGKSLGTFVTGGAELKGANGVTFGPDGNLYISGEYSNHVVEYNGKTGGLVAVLDPTNAAGLSAPQGLKFGPDGNLYVASYNNDKIVRFTSTGGTYEPSEFAKIIVPGVPSVGPIDPEFNPAGNLIIGTWGAKQVLEYGGPMGKNAGQLVLSFEPSSLDTYACSVDFQPPAAGGPASTLQHEFLVDAVDPTTYLGHVERFNTSGQRLGLLIENGSGGLALTGGIALGPGGVLYVANVKVDANFNDIGSQILKFDPRTGAFLGVFVESGEGLNVPFAMVFH